MIEAIFFVMADNSNKHFAFYVLIVFFVVARYSVVVLVTSLSGASTRIPWQLLELPFDRHLPAQTWRDLHLSLSSPLSPLQSLPQ
jgi:hypothetical protein